LVRAARALAAFEERPAAETSDLARAAPMALRHRLRKDAFGAIDETGRIERALEEFMPEALAHGAA